MFSRVVFPEPDSPMIATYSPFSTLKDTLESACTWFPPKRVVYIFFTLFTSKIGISVTSFRFSWQQYNKRRNCNAIGAAYNFSFYLSLL